MNVTGGNLQIWNQYQQANGAVANVSITTISGAGFLDLRNSSGSSAGGPFSSPAVGAGTLNMNGGTLLWSRRWMSRAASAAVSGVASQGVVNLNGGVITCNTVTTASANTSGTVRRNRRLQL